MPICLEHERQFIPAGINAWAGMDEAGIGPLAGPVVAACVVIRDFDALKSLGINDSKKLTPKKRDVIYQNLISSSACVYSVGIAGNAEIDAVNILQASFIAMKRAWNGLEGPPSWCLVDGRNPPSVFGARGRAVVGGDASCLSIAAASIVAKVTRDRIMEAYHERFPVYEFSKNKGYPTKSHVQAILNFGICEIHRRSYAPCGAIKKP